MLKGSTSAEVLKRTVIDDDKDLFFTGHY